MYVSVPLISLINHLLLFLHSKLTDLRNQIKLAKFLQFTALIN